MTEHELGCDPGRAALVAEKLKALGHPLRLRITALLACGPRRVGELAELLEVGQATVSQQLRILRMSRIVMVARSGGVARYRVAEPGVKSLLTCLAGSVCSHEGAADAGTFTPREVEALR